MRPREQKGAKGRDFAARTIINGFDSNFLFVCPPLMFLFVDRSSPTSCNLFPRCLFIFFPTFPFQTFRLLLIYRVKDEVSTCEDSRLLVKRFFSKRLNSTEDISIDYRLVVKIFEQKYSKLFFIPQKKEKNVYDEKEKKRK